MIRILVALTALLFALPVYAQFVIPGSDSALSLSLSPRYPTPGQNVQVSLRSFLYDLGASDITWTQDGKVLAESEDSTSVTVRVPELGKATTINVSVFGSTGTASIETTIAPATVDLLWEADTYVPPFYTGRALPSAGSNVRIAAIPHFVRENGSAIAPGDIIFTWKKDGQILEADSGRGKSSATVEAPTLFGSEAIQLDAVSVDGSLAAQTILRLFDTKPSLLLYEDHPLFGVLYGQTLGATSFIPDNEMTFAAIPLFAPVQSTSDPRLEYAWSVNHTAIQADSAHADELTINAASSTGLALIELSLTHSTNFFFSSEGAWQITLRSGGSAANPFR